MSILLLIANFGNTSYCRAARNYSPVLRQLLIGLILFSISGLLAAQDAANSYSAEVRTAETDILLNTPAAENPGAINAGPEEGEAAALPGLGFGDFLRMILVLLIVIGLIYGFFWLLKRFSGMKPEGIEAIKVLSTRPLKGDTALHIVETGTRIFLIGSTSNAVNLLKEIDDKESMDEIRLAVSRNAPIRSGGFARFFNNRINSEQTVGEPDLTEPASFIHRQRGRLQDL